MTVSTSPPAAPVTTTQAEAPRLEELAARIESLESELAALKERQPDDRVSMVVFSGELDRVLAAFVVATGAAAMGQEVSMFFTFWGLSALKKKSVLGGKSTFEAMMSAMTPSSSRDLGVSRMNYFGIGAKMLRKMMRDKNVASLEELMSLAQDLEVKMVACEMSRDVMGIRDEELIEGLEPGGVGSFLGDALNSRTTLFI